MLAPGMQTYKLNCSCDGIEFNVGGTIRRAGFDTNPLYKNKVKVVYSFKNER